MACSRAQRLPESEARYRSQLCERLRKLLGWPGKNGWL
jgi:hypothetical protein